MVACLCAWKITRQEGLTPPSHGGQESGLSVEWCPPVCYAVVSSPAIQRLGSAETHCGGPFVCNEGSQIPSNQALPYGTAPLLYSGHATWFLQLMTYQLAATQAVKN